MMCVRRIRKSGTGACDEGLGGGGRMVFVSLRTLRSERRTMAELGPLAVLSLDGTSPAELSPLLRQVNLPVLWFTSVADLAPFLPDGGVVVVGCGTVDARTCLPAINELWASVRPLKALVALSDGRVDPTFLHMLPADTDALFLPSDAHILRPTVSRALLHYLAQRLESVALAGHEWHPLLRASVRHILRRTVISVRHTDASEGRSLRAVAAGVGVSQEYLSRIARTESLPLRELADRWLVVQGAVVRALEGEPWERIAWRAGFESASGLSDLCMRAGGLRLRALAAQPPEDVLAEFHDWLASCRER